MWQWRQWRIFSIIRKETNEIKVIEKAVVGVICSTASGNRCKKAAPIIVPAERDTRVSRNLEIELDLVKIVKTPKREPRLMAKEESRAK